MQETQPFLIATFEELAERNSILVVDIRSDDNRPVAEGRKDFKTDEIRKVYGEPIT